MTTLVTRLYDDPAHADAVAARLKADGFPEATIDIIEQGSRMSAQERIEAAGVPAAIARQYAQHLTSTRALLVVRAPFVPFGAARRAMEVADDHPAVNAGVAEQNLNLPDRPDPERFLSVLGSHRLFLTDRLETRARTTPRGLSKSFNIPTLAEKGRRVRPAVIDAPQVSAFFFPFALVSRRRSGTAKMLKGFMSRVFMPIPLLSGHRQPRNLRHYRITN